MIIRDATASDASAWLVMRRDLWPDGSEAEHAGEIAEAVGFVEVARFRCFRKVL